MTPNHSHRLAAGLLGGFAMAAFVGLSETLAGLNVVFRYGATYSSPGEVYFWLGHALLLFPGACLLGYALSPWLGPLLARSWRGIEQMDRRQGAAGLLLLTAATVLVARAGHALLLLDYPVTDDENAARFGGQVLAMGRLMIPAPQPSGAFPTLYLYLRDGMVTSFDWPGPQLAWAVVELSGLGPWVFALAAASGQIYPVKIRKKKAVEANNSAVHGPTIEKVLIEHRDFDRFHADVDHPRRAK